MKSSIINLLKYSGQQLLIACVLFCITAPVSHSLAQCPVSTAPSYSRSCFTEYFTALSATGSGAVSSTVSLTGGSCTGTYFNLYSTQGITANLGDTIKLSFSRYTTDYTAWVSINIDGDHDNYYIPYYSNDAVYPYIPLSPTTMSGVYTFVVPCGITAGTPLHMRLMLSESNDGRDAPCAATYGQTYDYKFTANCPSPMPFSGIGRACPAIQLCSAVRYHAVHGPAMTSQ